MPAESVQAIEDMSQVSETMHTGQASGRERRRRPWRRTMMGLFLAFLLVLGVQRLPEEVSAWYLAAAEIAAEAGQTELALQRVDQAARWVPNSPRPRAARIAIYRHVGQYDEALALFDEAIEQSDSEALRLQRYELLLEAGREKEVLAYLKEKQNRSATLGVRRGVATAFYVRKQFEAALRVLNDDATAEEESSHAQEWARTLILRSEIYRELGQYEEALAQWDRAVKLEPTWARSPQQVHQRIQLLCHLQRFDEVEAACRQLDEQASFWTKQTDAAFLNSQAYFRAVANRDLGTAEIQAERAVKLTLGSANVLDTRGYVRWRLGKLEDAADDLDSAVESLEAERRRITRRIKTVGLISRTSLQTQELDQNALTLAVILYHRSLVYDSRGQAADAERDRNRVRELGYEPNDRLF
jgi:tetratricopeptide (TPR) repeat protein